MYLLGDSNININTFLNPSTFVLATDYINMLSSNNLFPFIFLPTQVTEISSTTSLLMTTNVLSCPVSSKHMLLITIPSFVLLKQVKHVRKTDKKSLSVSSAFQK